MTITESDYPADAPAFRITEYAVTAAVRGRQVADIAAPQATPSYQLWNAAKGDWLYVSPTVFAIWRAGCEAAAAQTRDRCAAAARERFNSGFESERRDAGVEIVGAILALPAAFAYSQVVDTEKSP